MKIRLEDDALTGQLLAFLREQGCIAYYDSASSAIEAIAPHLFGTDETETIRGLVERWQKERPGVTIQMKTDDVTAPARPKEERPDRGLSSEP